MKPRIVLLTGATGLVGSYLTKVLLSGGYKVYALVRRKDSTSARDRLLNVLKFWDEDVLYGTNEKLNVLEGDITAKNLGLNKSVIGLLTGEVDQIYHCAAVTQFNGPLQALRKINVEGTRNVLEFAVKCKEEGRLEKVNHVSTAYVCGDYKGIFKEDDLDVGQSFHSTYEQSKYEAEKIVEDYRKRDLWVDVFRPSALVGESKMGRIFQFKHLYQLLNLWSRETLEVFPINKLFSINFASVDIVASSLFCLSCNTKRKNKNYHLFGARPSTENEIFHVARKLIGFKKPRMVSWEKFTQMKTLSPVQKNFINKAILISSSFNRNLDSAKTLRILNNYNFKFPDFTRKQLINVIQYTLDSEFIKRN